MKEELKAELLWDIEDLKEEGTFSEEELDEVEMLLDKKTLTKEEANKILTIFDGDLVQEEIERIVK
jgi:hypothetical protein